MSNNIYVINLSLKQSIVPSDFEMARVVPLFKQGDRNKEGHYCSVSILPVLSNVFERIVYNQFYAYLCDNNLIYKYQSGFRASFSTETALTYMYLCDQINFNIDSGLYTGHVLLDLLKAFDAADHNILLQKIEAVGANSAVKNGFKSYVIEREDSLEI